MRFSAEEIRAAWARYLGKTMVALMCAPEDERRKEDEDEEGEELENGIFIES